MGPGKQRISERSLWWTVKRKDTTNNSFRLKFTQTILARFGGMRYRRGAQEQR
jgi:hypothetical protein